MEALTLGILAIFGYGLLSLGGGLMGYIKSQSVVSLVSGGISGVLLLVLAVMKFQGADWAATVAAIVIAGLVLVFAMRWYKTRKPMPAIPMIGCGVLSLVLISAA